MINSTPRPSQTGPDADQVFSILSDPRRRRVLQILQRESSMKLSALATRVARCEREEATASTVDDVRTALHHCHLPKLAEAGLIEYRAVSESIELTDAASAGLSTQLSALE